MFLNKNVGVHLITKNLFKVLKLSADSMYYRLYQSVTEHFLFVGLVWFSV
jgi:hypothetical protein